MAKHSRDFYKAATLDILHSRISLNAGEMSVIDNRRLPNMPRGSCAIISQDVYQKMQAIGKVTNRTNAEVPFVLYGRVHGQTVFFNIIDADASAGDSNLAAVYSERQNNTLKSFVINAPRDGTYIVAKGHTHPRIGGYYLNFSLADMIGDMQFRQDNDVFNTGQIELCSVLLTGGNYNFLFYDGNDYYKFNSVFVLNNDGSLQPLPCYGPDVEIARGRGGRGY